MKFLRANWGATAAALALYFVLVIALQLAVGAPAAQFGGYPDEPSHYISGMLIHDYLLNGLGQKPSTFAYHYYTHVPYFGIGNWPPFYYLVEALWMCCFGPGRAAALWMTALVAAACAALIFATLRKSLGSVIAFCAGLLFLLSPVVQWSSTLVMTDLAVTAMTFAAALAFANYLDSEGTRAAAAFAVLAGLALLTKASAFFLVAIPPVAVLLTGKFGLLKRPSFWMIPVVTAAFALPWYAFARHFAGVGFAGYSKPSFLPSLEELCISLGSGMGWLMLPVLIGVWSMFRVRPFSSLAVVCAVEPVAVLLFLAKAPIAAEERYLVAAFPPILVFAAFGIDTLASFVKQRRRMVAASAMIAVVLATASVWLFQFERPQPNPLRPIADFIIGHNSPAYTAVLVNADNEGPMIAEIAGRDPQRMLRFLIRPGKLFARMNWIVTRYELRYRSPQEVQAVIDRLPISVVIIRRNPPTDAFPHELMLRDAIHSFPDRWRPVQSFDSDGTAYDLYEPVSKSSMTSAGLSEFLMNLLGGVFHPNE